MAGSRSFCAAVASTALAGAAALAAGAGAQAPDLEAERVGAVADLILEVLPEEGRSDELSWYAVAVRTGSNPGLHWHLAEPDAYEGEFSGPDAYRRTGWIETTGRQTSLAACGTADLITGLAFRFGEEDAGEVLIAALSDHGTTVKQIGEVTRPLDLDDNSELGVDPAERSTRYALAAPGRPPAAFEATVSCTPLGSRAARRCWTNVSVTFAPDDPQAIVCLNPGHY